MNMDVQDYIQKPVLPGELIRRVKRIVGPASSCISHRWDGHHEYSRKRSDSRNSAEEANCCAICASSWHYAG